MRIARALFALTGGDKVWIKRFMHTRNKITGGVPAKQIASIEGLMIWTTCQGQNHIGQLSGSLYRLVESQEQVATMGYVDTLYEQVLLEELLESVKPPYPDGLQGYHYLLTTPFRYPPLLMGVAFWSN